MAILSGFPSGVMTADIALPKMVKIADAADGIMYHFDSEHMQAYAQYREGDKKRKGNS